MLKIFFTLFITLSLFSSESFVYFKGNKLLTTKEIQSALGIEVEKSWYDFYKSDIPKVDDTIKDSLNQSILNIYKNEGFYHTTVSLENKDENLTISIVEERPVRIKSIQIDSDISKYMDKMK